MSFINALVGLSALETSSLRIGLNEEDHAGIDTDLAQILVEMRMLTRQLVVFRK
jgi:hypothetical protein